MKAGASVIYILGATGTRMDHTFTNICNMKAALDSDVPCFICDSHNKIYLVNDRMGEVKVSKKDSMVIMYHLFHYLKKQL